MKCLVAVLRHVAMHVIVIKKYQFYIHMEFKHLIKNFAKLLCVKQKVPATMPYTTAVAQILNLR